MTRIEKLKRIQYLLANEAGKSLAYKSWSDDYCRSHVQKVRDGIIEQIGRVSLMGLTSQEADDLGFGKWNDTSKLRLAPIWLYPFLLPGDKLESISGKSTVVGEDYTVIERADGEKNEGYIDNDTRFDFLAYGVQVEA